MRVLSGPTISNEEERLHQMTNPDEIKIGISYTGPHIHFPMTTLQLQNLISAFKSKQVQWALIIRTFPIVISHQCFAYNVHNIAFSQMYEYFMHSSY